MKLLLLSTAATLLQMAVTTGPTAEPRHLRYERALYATQAGTTCVVLDAGVFAHTASRSAADLRLFAGAGETASETPFALTENSPQPAEVQAAAVQNLGVKGGAIVFDLAMPSRQYSEVELDLDAKDFIATADVQAQGSRETVQLGTFTLFDLSSQHLPRSTKLALQETKFSVLHVKLRFSTPEGKPLTLPASVVRGASVPPSREAQSLYTTVATTNAISQQSGVTTADINVAAHVPVERVAVALDPAFHADFYRQVKVEDAEESVDGEIVRINRTSAIPGAPALHEEQLSVDAVLAANLRNAASIKVSIANGNDAPLPVQSIALQMRQRRICFRAAANTAYVLRYGDEALAAPVYDYARLFEPATAAVTVALGAEQTNQQFIARSDARPYTERHPEILWIALLTVVAVLGATALSSVKKQGRPS